MHKTLLIEYDGTEFRIVQYHMVDNILLVGLMFVFFPREYPLHYRDELDDWRDKEINGEVYIACINERGWELKKDDLNIGNNVPIIVQHPFGLLDHSSDNECINDNEESDDMGKTDNELIINRVLRNCSIGFVNKY